MSSNKPVEIFMPKMPFKRFRKPKTTRKQAFPRIKDFLSFFLSSDIFSATFPHRSELDDFISVPRTQLTYAEFTGGHSIESSTRKELSILSCPIDSLLLGVNMTQSSKKPNIPVDSDSSEKISDIFG
ncbi:hypothetical protein TorRG33x02_271420 [Trema orientale]|uniref:Uncharacterized protein n=1 Tax=Trema orientale TaxID=63057 RepID=A0A2P5CW43_TREOI|nr:hypothetical protein TorRG33x02_271420 [Trema orientale]